MAYNPGVSDQSGLMLMQGLGGLGAGLGQGLAAMGQQMERQREERKRESDEFKALQQLAESAYGIPKNQTTALGLAQLRAEVRSKEIGRIEEERKQRMQYNQAQMDALGEATKRNKATYERETRNAELLPQLLRRSQAMSQPAPMRDMPAYSPQPDLRALLGGMAERGYIPPEGGTPMPAGPGFPERPMDMQRLGSLLESSGYKLDPERPVENLQALGEVVLPKQAERKEPQFVTDPETGARYAILGNTMVRSEREKPAQTFPTNPQAIPILTPDGKPTGKAYIPGTDKVIDLSPPNSEGKTLSQTEVDRIAALNQAEMDIASLEEMYQGLGVDFGGPISGRLKSLFSAGQNANIIGLENAITAATPNLARGVFREVGVLTDEDVKRYKSLLPSPNDTEEVRKRKFSQLRKRIEEGRKDLMGAMEKSGRDVSGFTAAGNPKGEAPAQFDSEAAARAAGKKAGDTIMLYDSTTAKYRKARLN